ncbi:NACHT domain-containing protein [Oscillatoria sp. FACHB-1407]|uniref:NACHT domain-containing protein n=1 Tax=Oscillatoria sp. FACHB-1407 TaxID=2692847 RepID=UPI001683E786|nr:NACHT domain-containing protein [Oscillatoria sp. FACHB-1407]MBD2465365.1 NACHT domain-containing protein [Oscillatoria sp. FACHB-1407]
MDKDKRSSRSKKKKPQGSIQRATMSVYLTESGLRRLKGARSTYYRGGKSESDLIDAASTSASTLKRFFLRENVDYDTAVAIAIVLGLTEEQFHECIEERCPGQTPAFKEPEAPPDIPDPQLNLLLDRRDCLYRSLQEQTNRLTSSPLLGDTEPGRGRKDLFIPLQIVRREKSPQHFSRLQQNSFETPAEVDREEITALALETLLKQLLENLADSQSPGLRIAIVGDTGAGKTTFLQEFAEKIFEPPSEPEFGQLANSIAIWVSLADLKEPLEEHLLGEWLETALKQRHIDKETEDALEDLCQRKKVWLLLDGLDEYSNSSDSVSKLLKQLKGWLSNAHVILSSRPHLWAGRRNELDGFEIYQILDLGQPDSPSSVDAFLHKWWANEPELLSAFRSELHDPRNEQVRDLAKNPLLLTLLCKTWEILRRPMPSTKAGLYKEFVEAVDSWKRPTLSTADAQPEELYSALPRLACTAIDGGSHFWIQEELVKEILSPQLLGLATGIGWLKPMQVVTERQIENAYAFIHSSFQEYFASLAVRSRDFFLPCDHQNKPVKDETNPDQYKPYRVFDPHWREVILFWLGRNPREITAAEKDQFMWSVLQFDDGCENLFDRTRIYTLTDEGRNVFDGCSLNEVTSEDKEASPTVLFYDEWDDISHVWSDEAWLYNVKQYREKLTKFLGYWMHSENCINEPPDIDPSSLSDFDYMVHMVQFTTHKLNPGYKLYQKAKNQVEQLKTLRREELEAIDGFEFRDLVKRLNNSKDPFIRGRVVNNLINKHLISEDAIAVLIKHSGTSFNLNFMRSIAWILAQCSINQTDVVKAMASLLTRCNDKFVQVAIADYFYDLMVDSSTTTELLKLIIGGSNYGYKQQGERNPDCAHYFRHIIVRCSSRMSYTEFYDSWHKPTVVLQQS